MKRNLKSFVIFIFLFFISSCQKSENIKPSEDIWIGMNKAEIIKVLGATNEKRYISKTNNQIQGPEKEFWHEIPKGTKIEVWTYHTAQGQLKLYFIGNSSELKFKILLK